MREVLIVDQDRLWVDLIREALAEQGVGVRVSADGAEALQLVRTGSFDAVVLSVDLRGMSGYSICNRLKKDPALARVPLLLTSAEASEETFSQHSRLKTRAEAYLRKPFDKPALWLAVAAMWDPAAADPATAAPAAPAAPVEPVVTSWAAAGPAPIVAAQPAAAETPAARTPLPMGDALQDRIHPQAPPPPPPPDDGDDDDRGDDSDHGDRGAHGDPSSREPYRDDGEEEATKVGEMRPQAPLPEVTVVRAVNPTDVAASLPDRRRSTAVAKPLPPTKEPAPAIGQVGSEPGSSLATELEDSRARLVALAAQRLADEAAWLARLEAVQAELAAARALAAGLQAQRERADHGLEQVLRLLRGPLG